MNKKHHLDGTADGWNLANQLRLVVYSPLFTNRVLAPSNRWWFIAGFLVPINSINQESMAKSRRSFLAAKSAAASCVEPVFSKVNA